jgi:hypothetical protein
MYAIEDLRCLIGKLSHSSDLNNPEIRYLCGLFAELAYYHVPQWEIDGNKRAKHVPCEVYQTIVSRGEEIDSRVLLQPFDLPPMFAVANRNVVAVGQLVKRVLFIGFRGTHFSFDWKINLRSQLVPVSARLRRLDFLGSHAPLGRLHVGFLEEAVHIAPRILHAIYNNNLGPIDHVVLTGHSLGGAVAAVSQRFFRSIARTSVCILGAPRYADAAFYWSQFERFPVQIRRPGDIVPTVPPRAFGYVDHPNEFTTDGKPYLDPASYASLTGGALRWARFLSGRFEPHSIEAYRHELGLAAGFPPEKREFADLPKLTQQHLQTPLAQPEPTHP